MTFKFEDPMFNVDEEEISDESILAQKDEIIRLVQLIFYLGPEDIRVEQLANRIYSNFLTKVKIK